MSTLSGVYINSKFAFNIAVENLMKIIKEKQEHVMGENGGVNLIIFDADYPENSGGFAARHK